LRGPPLNRVVNATRLSSALRQCDLGAEFPLVAVLRLSESDP